jgi:hypothetical protein
MILVFNGFLIVVFCPFLKIFRCQTFLYRNDMQMLFFFRFFSRCMPCFFDWFIERFASWLRENVGVWCFFSFYLFILFLAWHLAEEVHLFMFFFWSINAFVFFNKRVRFLSVSTSFVQTHWYFPISYCIALNHCELCNSARKMESN